MSPTQKLVWMYGRANLSKKNVHFNHFSLIWCPLKVLHPLQRGHGSRLTLWWSSVFLMSPYHISKEWDGKLSRCAFSRRVRRLVGGSQWAATAVGGSCSLSCQASTSDRISWAADKQAYQLASHLNTLWVAFKISWVVLQISWEVHLKIKQFWETLWFFAFRVKWSTSAERKQG